MGIGNHQTRGVESTDDWLTPPEIIRVLGPFDLDPCASVNQPWRTAATQYTARDDGRMRRWEGVVWLNPPYGGQTGLWLSRLADHGCGIALIFARTETDFFFRQVWERADAVLFLRGRLTFHTPDGELSRYNSGGPSVLVAYSAVCRERLMESGLNGKMIDLRGGV